MVLFADEVKLYFATKKISVVNTFQKYWPSKSQSNHKQTPPHTQILKLFNINVK